MTKENIKQFFKPNVWKIVLAFLMFFTVSSIIAVVYVSPFVNLLASKLYCPPCDIFEYCAKLSGINIGEIVGGIIFFAIMFAYYYFLSCLLIFLYREIKSKKLK